MLKNFLLTSLRNFRKNRTFTALNLLGLSVAIAGIFTIYQFVQSELSVDAFQQNVRSTYLITAVQQTEASSREVGLFSMSTNEWLKSKNSEIASTHVIRNIGKALIRNGNVKTEPTLTLTEPNFFDYFNIPLLKGDAKTALSKPNSIILSETTATALFGDANPIGQQVEVFGDYLMPLQVTGVIKDNLNTHFNYDCLVSWDSRPKDSEHPLGHWYRYSLNEYFKTAQPENPDKLAQTLTSRHREEFPEDNISFRVYPLEDIYLKTAHVQFLPGYRSGNETSIRILSLIAVLILVISVVNYININISLVLKRIKEIGMRKVMGATKMSLGAQFLAESITLVLGASLIAITLSDLMISKMPDLFENLNGPFVSLQTSSILAGLTLIIGVLSGLYPAIFISRIKLSDGLKSQLTNRSQKGYVRNVLMGIQFMITFGLLIMSIVVFRQYSFVQNKELGFSKNNVLILNIGNSGKISSSSQAFAEVLRQLPEVKSASITTDIIGTGYTNNSYFAIKEGQTNANENGVMSTYFSVDPHFIPTYSLQMSEGRNLEAQMASDSNAVVINQTLATKLGLESPVGSKIKLFGEDSRSMNVIGVVKDFNFQSLHQEVTPAALYLAQRNFWNLSVQFDPENLTSLMPKLEASWQEFDSEVPFAYSFLDDKLARFYQQDQRFTKMITGFAALSIILSLVGLFGLTAFSIEQRLKEISIRKVLGADIKSLMMLFNRRVMIVFLTAGCIALPVSYVLVNNWLSNFAYHIPNHWLIYLTAALSIFLLIVLTVSITALRAASSNPAKYLRDD
ncbi:ABC transporter permease [Marinoscillum sp.]|uniref:ABC transporter permease n=1 Tax=Marinoscillum sp. TaxID=2024838 RepID=UPI003BAB8B59